MKDLKIDGVYLFAVVGNIELKKQDGVVYNASENVCYRNVSLFWWFLCSWGDTVSLSVSCHCCIIERHKQLEGPQNRWYLF
jgi:hypothetical protein